jgi:hypothetical protein
MDREVVLAAVQQYGGALYYACAELRADREVVLAAVQQDGYALYYASAELRANREVVLAAVQQRVDALYYASAELKADREVVLAAVQQYGGALHYACAELRADREVVLAAVQQDGDALEYASEELQTDDAVLKACNHIELADLDRLADRGQLKVLRTLASVRKCGRQMNNCLANYDLAQCDRHILVKLDGDDGIPLAVGSFANGAWEEIRYARPSVHERGGGNRACARGIVQQLLYHLRIKRSTVLPSLTPFCPRCKRSNTRRTSRAQFENMNMNMIHDRIMIVRNSFSGRRRT